MSVGGFTVGRGRWIIAIGSQGVARIFLCWLWAMAGLPVGEALGQDVDCARLQAALAASQATGSGLDSGGQDAYARAAQRQRSELARTRAYATSVGCDSRDGIFGDPAPEQCDAISARIGRMQDNLTELEARGRPDEQAGGHRADLLARYNAACVGDGNPADLSRGPAGGFFRDDGRNPADLRTIPINPDQLSNVPLNGDIIESEPAPQRAGKAICVRTCDGGFFPLVPSASHDQLDHLEDLCKASCPNTEAHLYTMGQDGTLQSATALDGQPYTSLAAAFKFEKTFTASCTCKPPNQTWVQALAEAEKLLGPESKGDITVTAKMSEDMLKAAPVTPPAAKAKGKKKSDRSAAAVLPDATMTAEGLRASQVPTASAASGAINPLSTQTTPTTPEAAGPTKAARGRGGPRKTIRLIAP